MSKIKIVQTLIYAMFITGLVLVFWNSFKDAYYQAQLNKKIKREEKGDGAKADNNLIIKKLTMMLKVVFDKADDSSALAFLVISFGLGGTVLLLLTSIFNLKLGIIGFVGVGCIPFLYLKMKMQTIQIEASREGETFIAELLGNYLINHQNMREAIEITATELDGAPNSRRLLLNLANNIAVASTRADVYEAIEIFRFSLATSWGDILATNMRFAILDGIIVTDALRDLSAGITNARKTLEQNQRENNESKILLNVFFPILCVGVFLGAVLLFDFTPQKFFMYQFDTALGMTYTIILAVGYIICRIVTAALTRQKMDI